MTCEVCGEKPIKLGSSPCQKCLLVPCDDCKTGKYCKRCKDAADREAAETKKIVDEINGKNQVNEIKID